MRARAAKGEFITLTEVEVRRIGVSFGSVRESEADGFLQQKRRQRMSNKAPNYVEATRLSA